MTERPTNEELREIVAARDGAVLQLMTELEGKDKRIAELESELEATKSDRDKWRSSCNESLQPKSLDYVMSDLAAERRKVAAEKQQTAYVQAELDRLRKYDQEVAERIETVTGCKTFDELLEFCRKVAALKLQVGVAREALETFVKAIGSCACAPAYTSRGLEDPECDFHEYEFEIADAQKALAALPSSELLDAVNAVTKR